MGTGCVSTFERVKLRPSFVVLGGYLDGTVNKFILIFDLERCTLKRAIKLPNKDSIPLVDFAVSGTDEGHLYITGGRYGRYGALSEVWMVDVRTNSDIAGQPFQMMQSAQMNIIQRQHSSCYLQTDGCDYLYIVGGKRSHSHFLGCSRLNIYQLKWESLPAFPNDYPTENVKYVYSFNSNLYVVFETSLKEASMLKYKAEDGVSGDWIELQWTIPLGKMQKVKETWYILSTPSKTNTKLFAFYPSISPQQVSKLYSLPNCCAIASFQDEYLFLLAENKLYRYDIMQDDLLLYGNLPFIFEGDDVNFFITDTY